MRSTASTSTTTVRLTISRGETGVETAWAAGGVNPRGVHRQHTMGLTQRVFRLSRLGVQAPDGASGVCGVQVLAGSTAKITALQRPPDGQAPLKRAGGQVAGLNIRPALAVTAVCHNDQADYEGRRRRHVQTSEHMPDRRSIAEIKN
jgi:hypothetical protein